jgi:hypothetical protein
METLQWCIGMIRSPRVNRTPLRRGEFVHVRRWYLPPEGGQEFRPTRYGVAIPVDQMPDLLAAIELVCPEAIERWLAGDFEGVELVQGQREWLTRRERRALALSEKRKAREESKRQGQLEELRQVMGGRR